MCQANTFICEIVQLATLKYEEVYLHAYSSVSEAKRGIARYIELYNTRRPHSKLDRQTPDEFYHGRLLENKLAA